MLIYCLNACLVGRCKLLNIWKSDYLERLAKGIFDSRNFDCGQMPSRRYESELVRVYPSNAFEPRPATYNPPIPTSTKINRQSTNYNPPILTSTTHDLRTADCSPLTPTSADGERRTATRNPPIPQYATSISPITKTIH
ncbi:hypothetical protein NA56DRAFT_712576 [Hyaloscypha hepaticicola]|uniref:Uncharacterized protein n=1 Tax=Hyaloscypha hepaticicola TaxID=2082293 RepID=A0A2J6PG90_9HELO|nr:hypothetical protein NA56DRAFT_712576 [Hyaloscypha hepaticicola]